MNANVLKYSAVFIAVALAFFSLSATGWLAFSAAIYIFLMVPLLDAILPSDESNMTKAEEKIAKADRTFDYILYAIVPLQFAILFYFLYRVSDPGLMMMDRIAYIFTMGISCVSFGINVAHELGHRHTKMEQNMSKALLLTTSYMHFFIEHNRGHHKNVSTHEDPASADKWEIVYLFWFKSVIGGYKSAWDLEADRLRKAGLPFWSLKNEMIQYHIIQLLFCTLIFALFGGIVLLHFLMASAIGVLFLETVNYLEHYGLRREKVSEGIYEKVQPHHSWNSNHPVGRIMLFELTRHSDHHYNASRKYQILRHFPDAPQMPMGYPAMILMTFIPPLWFFVMHRQIAKYEKGLQKFEEQESNLGKLGLG